MSMKQFVSSKEAEEARQRRQEEWEKIRKPSDPLQRPEVEYDPRSLYERLQDEKNKKQEQWDETHALKNMIYKGLDEDEAEFLTQIATKAEEQDTQRWIEEADQIKQFRSAIAEKTLDEKPIVVVPRKAPSTRKKSQAELLAGSIKRKSQSGDAELDQGDEDPPAKHKRTDNADAPSTQPPSVTSTPPTQPSQSAVAQSSVPASATAAQPSSARLPLPLDLPLPIIKPAPAQSKISSLLGDYADDDDEDDVLNDEYV